MERNKKEAIAFGLTFLTIFVVLTVAEHDYLYHLQELNLFLYTPLFFTQQMVVPAGMLTWLGTYFTQYFYYPWLGTLIFCLWLMLMAWLIKRTFRVPTRFLSLVAVPVALVLLTNFTLGYWIYYFKLRGFFFIAVMGTSLAVVLTWLFRVIVEKVSPWAGCAFIVLTAVIFYPLAGAYALFSLLLMAVVSFRLSPKNLTGSIAHTVSALLSIAVVPPIYYRSFYYQTSFDTLWSQGLPLYSYDKLYEVYYTPYILLAISLLLLAAMMGAKWLQREPRNHKRFALVQTVFLIAVVAATYGSWYKDSAFRAELKMNAAVDCCDWEEVLRVMRDYDEEPTRMMVMNKTLALFKLGRAGNEMYAYRDGSRTPDSPFELRMIQMGGKNIYFHYGLVNYCYRWCLEDGVEFGWRAEHLKFLMRCSILNGEWSLARKYADLLRQTKYHAEWLEPYEKILATGDYSLVAHDKALGPILPLLAETDNLGSDQSVIELYLLNSLAYRQTENPVCAELVLLCAMQLKDIPTFWGAFMQYARVAIKDDKAMPRHYQEAAYLYGHLEKTVNIANMPFDESVKRRYAEFMQMAQRCQSMSEDQMKESFRPMFGDTFYYNYFLLRGLKTY